jgi:lipid-binding SYLF domain-containing protein
MKLSVSLAAVAALFFIVGCNTTPKSGAVREQLRTDAQSTLRKMESQDPSVRDLISRSYGYVVFPSIGKGGLIVGGAFGRGAVFERGNTNANTNANVTGNYIGDAELNQGSIGAQLGGATFAELIVFETQSALNKFRQEKLEFGADAQAVIVKAGAAGATSFRNGVAVLQMPEGGAFAGVALTGQKIEYVPLDENQTDRDQTNRNRTETRTETETRSMDTTQP